MIQAAKLVLKILLPIAVVVGSLLIARDYLNNKPEPFRRPQFKSVTAIEAMRVARSDFAVRVRTQGSVQAAKQSALASQVSGVVTGLAANLVSGGFFKAGDALLQIDARDYEIALTTAEASRAQAEATLAEETARGEQAQLDWKRLGRKGQPSDLSLRKPQLAAAEAALASAAAQVARAQLDLDRTVVTAPYDGRVASVDVGEGQFVNRGSKVASIYSTDAAEVRLPLSSRQLGYVNLPHTGLTTAVDLSASIGGQTYTWPATIERTDGAIDQSNRQLFAIARVDQPYSASGDNPPLRIGQYVQASVEGKTLTDVFVIPRQALREDREVLLVTDDNVLQRQDVVTVWKDAEVAVVSEGLNDGDVISLTSLGTVVNGTRVNATVDGKPISNEPAQPDNTSIAPPSGEMNERLKRLKAMIDAGEDIPPFIRDRIQSRIDAGQPVPDWLREHLEKTAQ